MIADVVAWLALAGVAANTAMIADTRTAVRRWVDVFVRTR